MCLHVHVCVCEYVQNILRYINFINIYVSMLLCEKENYNEDVYEHKIECWFPSSTEDTEVGWERRGALSQSEQIEELNLRVSGINRVPCQCSR